MLNYGIVGNCKTCALIGKNGTVDWMCYPRFDSPSVFARLLDKEKGGSLSISPVGKHKTEQRYIRDTAILETRYVGEGWELVVHDFFPRYRKLLSNGKGKERLVRQNKLIRIIQPVKGKPVIRITYDPRPDYARCVTTREERDGQAIASCNNNTISCISNVPYEQLDGKQRIEVKHALYLAVGQEDDPKDFSVTRCRALLSATKKYWERWTSTLVLPEENRATIVRSAITLKLLTYSTTGAIIAAPTTSIPEQIGTDRTFDYRYCWLRDAAFCTDALKKIGRGYETRRLLDFVMDRTAGNGRLKTLYGIERDSSVEERPLDHLAGFKGSRPVRIGNAAASQEQNDIYGELIDIIYLYFGYYGYGRMTRRHWTFLTYLVEQIAKHWQEPDAGIWEFRGTKEHFTFSKLMCWVGVDRALRLAQHYDKGQLVKRWTRLRDEIREDILRKGYSEKAQAFTIHYGSDELDASLLLMTYHEFLEQSDPRLISTVKAIYRKLRNGTLVQRYRVKDDFGRSTSAFMVCSFWLVDALWYIGEAKKARKLYRKLIGYGNHLGLFSEDVDLKTKRPLGNFPQAYTHLALINSSILLSEWNAKRKRIEWHALPGRREWW